MTDESKSDSVLTEQIRELIVEYAGAEGSDIHSETSLFHDLGMDGDDAVEFFAAYEKRFGVDISDLWSHWNRFFGPEAPFNPFVWLFWWITGTLPRMVPITLRDLVESASSGRWIQPTHEPTR